MKMHEIDLSGLYLSLYTDDSGEILSAEIKKNQEGTDTWLPIALNNIYTEEVVE